MLVRSRFAAAFLAAPVSFLAQLRPMQPEPPRGWTPKELDGVAATLTAMGHDSRAVDPRREGVARGR